MALEIADYIKALVESNPPGPDPKSQGDDHLRLIKHVLKTQFASFTDGIALTLTETVLNGLGKSGFGSGTMQSFSDANALPAVGSLFVVSGTPSNGPPTAAAGDFVLQGVAGSTRFQLWLNLASAVTWVRAFNGSTWTGWAVQTTIGVAQTWQVVTGSRALGTGYTNSTGRPIEVQVTAQGSGTTSYLEAVIGGTILVARANTPSGNSNSLRFIVPVSATYTVSGFGGTNTLTNWSELR